MRNLKRLLEEKNTQDLNNALLSLKEINYTNTSDIKTWFLRNKLPKAKQQGYDFPSVQAFREYLKTRINKHFNKSLELSLAVLVLKEMPKLKEFTITVIWKKSQMWGSNPTAETFVSGLGWLSSGSIGGCGYDKKSTAVANILNQIPQLKLLMMQYKNKNANYKRDNRAVFGYGSGYGIIPAFEGGVGVNCYPAILKTIGYKFKTLSSSNNVDVYQITK